MDGKQTILFLLLPKHGSVKKVAFGEDACILNIVCMSIPNYLCMIVVCLYDECRVFFVRLSVCMGINKITDHQINQNFNSLITQICRN